MHTILSLDKRNRFHKFVLVFGCLAFAIGLIAYGTMGTFMRYSGDDYCYGQQITTHGFWKTQWNSYINAMPYSGNRYSLTFVAGIFCVLPPKANGVLPGLAIVLWVIGIFYTLRAGVKLGFIDLTRL